MTLRDFFSWIGENPTTLLGFFFILPFTALVALIIGKGEGNKSPWNYFYSALVYLSCIPGIFSVALSIYFFLFERGSILNANVYTQIVPVFSMIATLYLISRNVSFDLIPGFGKISGLMMMIGTALVFMWLIDRTHIIVWATLPIQYVFFALIALLLVFRFGLRNLFS